MARLYDVTLSDGRHVGVWADDPETVKGQAMHAEQTRLVLAVKKGLPIDPPMAIPVDVSEAMT